MKTSFLKDLPGHKYYSGVNDTLFEWKEPVTICKARFAPELRHSFLTLLILFPVFAVIGFLLFAAKVWREGHSLKEIPFSGLLLVSLIIASIFTLRGFVTVVLQRFSPTIVRLAVGGIGKWKSGWGQGFSCEYAQIRTVAVVKHDLVPDESAFMVTLDTGRQVYLAVPRSDIERALNILTDKGVHCEPSNAAIG